MSNTRTDSEEEVYQEDRIKHLMTVTMAYSSRRSNREPPKVFSRDRMFNQSSTAAKDTHEQDEVANKQAGCLPCRKK